MPAASWLSCVLLGACLIPAVGQAAERSVEVEGSSLLVEDPCARQVTIAADPALHGQVAVQATADHPEEIDRLSFDTQGAARVRPLHDQASCWTPAPDRPFTSTLRLLLRVPTGFGVSIKEPGFGHYEVGAIGPLALALSGAGVVQVARVEGRASIDLSGEGNVSIAQAAIDELNAVLSGAGGVTVSQGRIGRAQVTVSGAGTVGVGASVGDATAVLSGSGSVRFAAVAGRLDKKVSGDGTVMVGGAVVGGGEPD